MNTRKITLFTVISLFLTASALAQDTGRFFSSQGSECLAWNPAPAAGETVFWSGECINGYADGPGTLTYNVPSGGTSEMSSTTATFTRGKAQGYGIAQFSDGRRDYRYYIDGSSSRTVTKAEYARETAPKAAPTLVKNVNLTSLKSIVDSAGFTMSESSMTSSNAPFVRATGKSNLRYDIYGTACNDEGTRCNGIAIYMNDRIEAGLTADKINEVMLNHATLAAYMSSNGQNFSIYRYLILDEGQARENIIKELQLFDDFVVAARNRVLGTQ